MFGSHLSIAGALANAAREAEGLGLDTVQVFTKNQRQWKFAPLEEDAADEWVREIDRLGWRGRTVAHDSYLINMASPDDALWEKSIGLMREEIERCERLSIPFLVGHPGAHVGTGAPAGLRRIAEGFGRLFKETRGYAVVSCLENTAGGGSTLGRTFEELAQLSRLIHEKAGGAADGRVGYCLDTCHALAAGYDVTDEAKAAAVLAEFDGVCGLKHLRVLHLNDSKGGLGSRLDRHEHIGKGMVGDGAFAAVVNHPGLVGVPKIMETPKGQTPKGIQWDTLNLRRLRKLVRAGGTPDAPRTAKKRSAAKAPAASKGRKKAATRGAKR